MRASMPEGGSASVMKKFVNQEMAAPNVLRAPIDPDVTSPLRSFVTSRANQRRLFARSPQWRSDLRWLSPRSREDFEQFRRVFELLDVARHVKPYVDFNDHIRLFNAML